MPPWDTILCVRCLACHGHASTIALQASANLGKQFIKASNIIEIWHWNLIAELIISTSPGPSAAACNNPYRHLFIGQSCIETLATLTIRTESYFEDAHLLNSLVFETQLVLSQNEVRFRHSISLSRLFAWTDLWKRGLSSKCRLGMITRA